MINYSVFILRCWKDGNQVRFRVENPHENEIHLFKSIEELNRFLSHQFDKDSLTQDQHIKGDTNATV